ncbi:hypothetical protein [Streptomyces sundarbansensis]
MAEDRNNNAHTRALWISPWRSPSGVAEDRNPWTTWSPARLPSRWRSPSGVAEDRNSTVTNSKV